MTDKHKARTTMRPDDEIEVDDVELAMLKAQGVLYEGRATTDDGARRSVERQQSGVVSDDDGDSGSDSDDSQEG